MLKTYYVSGSLCQLSLVFIIPCKINGGISRSNLSRAAECIISRNYKHLLCDNQSWPKEMCLLQLGSHRALNLKTVLIQNFTEFHSDQVPQFPLNTNLTHTPEPYNSVKQMFDLILYVNLILHHGIS